MQIETPSLTSQIAADLIRTRRTVHNFKPEVPPRETILRALDLARWAPNHKLTEPWRFYLLGDETADAMIRLNAEIVTEKRGPGAGQAKLERWRTMPAWLVVTSRVCEDAFRTKEDYAACCCAIQNIMLYLWSEGIGMKWGTGGVTRSERFFELLGIDPAEEVVVGLFPYGYPAEVPSVQRKPVDGLLVELP